MFWFILLIVIWLNVNMLIVIWLNVIMLSVIRLCVILLNIIMLSVILLNVIAPFQASTNEHKKADGSLLTLPSVVALLVLFDPFPLVSLPRIHPSV
jgi:hypothetical protein